MALSLLNPIVHFWLHHTVQIVNACWCTSCASAKRVGQGEVGVVICRVTCTWWLLWLAVKGPWFGQDGPILTLAAWIGHNSHDHLVGGSFLARKAAWALSRCMTTDYAHAH